MCLIMHKKKEDELSDAFINNVWARNPHGWGVMGRDDDGVQTIIRGMSLQEFKNIMPSIKDKEMMIHFRYATHGTKDLANAHPFTIMEGAYLMHNGILSGTDYVCPLKQKSDTAMLVDKIKEFLPYTDKGLRDKWIQDYIKEEAKSSTIVLMDKDGFIFPTGPLSCETTKGMAVSNSYAYGVDNPTYKPYFNGYGGYSGGYDDDYYPQTSGYASSYTTRRSALADLIAEEVIEALLDGSMSEATLSDLVIENPDCAIDTILDLVKMVKAKDVSLETKKLSNKVKKNKIKKSLRLVNHIANATRPAKVVSRNYLYDTSENKLLTHNKAV